jgi:hypothetical protein
MALLGGVGTWGGLWREDIHLDLSHRRYSRGKGFWPKVERLEGSFNEIAGIFLATERRQSRYRAYTVWAVRLALPCEKEGLTVLSFDDENEAIRRLNALSLKLRLPIIQSPISQDKTLSSGILGTPLVGTLSGGVNESRWGASFSWQPPTGRITVSGRIPHRTIALPGNAETGATFFLAIAAVLLFCASLCIILVRFAGIRVRQIPPGEIPLILVMSCIAGGGVIVLGLCLASIRERIEEDASSLRFGTLVFGRPGKFTTLKKNEIVTVSVEAAVSVARRGVSMVPPSPPGIGKHQQIVVRSTVAVARMGVQLTPAERRWLCNAVLSMVAARDLR